MITVFVVLMSCAGSEPVILNSTYVRDDAQHYADIWEAAPADPECNVKIAQGYQ